MNEITTTTSALPVRCDVSVRVATMADLPFMDRLQKMHSKQLGYFPTKQFEGYIEGGHVLIAEQVAWASRPCSSNQERDMGGTPMLLGYCIAKDRYLKRDELGVIYQLCVAPGAQRKLVGASLLKAVFERSAYGCRLYCCWCAQDLDANYFWESLGFVPIAFRGGSTAKKRVHIFWQRRVRQDDASTPYWFPSKTDNGAIRQDRLVLPIPPGLHWRDPMPVLAAEAKPALTDGPESAAPRSRVPRTKAQPPTPTRPPRVQFGPPTAITASTRSAPHTRQSFDLSPPQLAKPVKPPKAKPPAAKIDPKYLAAARELRDRYLEHVNDAMRLPGSTGKYDVSRHLQAHPMPLLAAG